MSSCKAPNCDLKNFDQCNSSLQFCSLQGVGSGEEVSSRECNPKDTGIVNYLRTDEECQIISSVNAEFECKNKVGCEWGHPSIATNNLLEKKCIPNRKGTPTTTGEKTQAPYTCSQASEGSNTLGSWIIGDNKETGRYSMQEQDTFGCPKDKCNYIPRKSERVDGACSGSGGCESHITKELCLSVAGTCQWTANDSAYCGYNRAIKNILRDESNLDSITRTDDVCRKVTNPSEEACNYWGCIWDIKGKRNLGNEEEDEFVDYDITTSGICKYPNTENCKDNYCSQNTRSSASGKRRGYHPDGRCKGGVNEATNVLDKCETSNEMIIPHKTPGLMKLSGHTSGENTEISNLQRIIDNKHRLHKEIAASNLNLNDTVVNGVEVIGERNKLKNGIKELYHQSCEKRGKYPGPADSRKVFGKNKYDVSLKECTNNEGDSNILDLCGSVKSNYESNKYKSYLDYQKSGKCLFTGYEGDPTASVSLGAMKAAEDDCGETCIDHQERRRKTLEYGMNKCISTDDNVNDSRLKCVNVDFGGICTDFSGAEKTTIKTKKKCLYNKWIESCTASDIIAASCTGTGTDGTTNCSINFAEQVGSTESDCTSGAGEGCTFTPEQNCMPDAETGKCPEGCVVGGGSCDSDDSGAHPTQVACEEDEKDDRIWIPAGYCQWHDPGERCRVKEESFNSLECSTEDSHPLCVQNRRGLINELDTANKTEAMKIRCSTDCATHFTPAEGSVSVAEATESCQSHGDCIYQAATQAETCTTTPVAACASGTDRVTCEAAGSCTWTGSTCEVVNQTVACTAANTNQDTCEAGGVTAGDCTWTGDSCSPPENDTCTNAYQGNGMCLNRDGEEVTCRIGTDDGHAIYIAEGEKTECTNIATNTWIDDEDECTSQEGYHWYLPPVSERVLDGCRDILDPSDRTTITHTCVSKISNNGSLKQHLKCRKNYYQIHSYFKAEIKTILDGSGDKEDLLYNFLIGRKQDGTPEATAYWELQEKYRSERHDDGCVGQALAVAAVDSIDAVEASCGDDVVVSGVTTVTCVGQATPPTGADDCPDGCTYVAPVDAVAAVVAVAAGPCGVPTDGACKEGCIHIHGNSDCDDRCENIKHKINQIVHLDDETRVDNYTNDEIINNLAHYFITLIQIKDSFVFDIDSEDTTDNTIKLTNPVPIIRQGDTVKIVGASCNISDNDHIISMVASDEKTLTISGITAGQSTNQCKLKIISPNCKYDVERNLYRVDSEESRKHAGLYQLSNEDYPIITPTQGLTSSDRVISDNWTWDDDITTEDYEKFLSTPEEMKHIIEDIKYAPGKATILLEITTGEDGPPYEAVSSEETINSAFKSLGKMNPISFILGGEQPKIKLKEYPLDYPLVNVKRYFNGMIEIEIDGVDPGKIENDRVEYLRDTYSIDITDFGYKVHVREIIFHDIHMDIYFDSDIHNLYKKNDIIEIEKLQDDRGFFEDNFNKAYRLKTGRSTLSSPGPIYNKITDVDFIKNKITVDHIKRTYSGKYFPGRYRTKPEKCIVETITQPANTLLSSLTQVAYTSDTPHCDYKRDIWKGCLGLNPSTASCFTNSNNECRDRRITVENISDDTYCMKNGVPKVECSSGDIGGNPGAGVAAAASTPDHLLAALGWSDLNPGTGTGIGDEWGDDILAAITKLNNFNRTATGRAEDAKITDDEVNTYWTNKIDEVKRKINVATPIGSAKTTPITPFGDDDFLASASNDDAAIRENLKNYSEIIKLATGILNEIKYIAEESIADVSQGQLNSAESELTLLSGHLKTLEVKLDLNNKNISHYMNLNSKVNMIKVDSRYSAQVEELLKPRDDGIKHTIQLMDNDGTPCEDMEQGVNVLGTKKVVTDTVTNTYIIIDKFINSTHVDGSCKLEIKSVGQDLNGFTCIPNDVRFDGKIEEGTSGTLANKYSCNEIQHIYDLPNPLERKMCGKTSHNGIIHDSMFDIDPISSGFEKDVNEESPDFGKYTAPHDIFSTRFKNNDLNGWKIEYIEKTDGLTISQKGTGIIKDFTSTNDNYIFNIYNIPTLTSTQATKLEITNIIPLSIYEKVKGFDKGKEADKKSFTIKNYIRKDVNELSMMEVDPNRGYRTERLKYFPGITTRATCEYNNGIWEGLDCKSHDVSSRVRNTDICENTGYTWNKETNVCILDGEYNTKGTSETRRYCDNKTSQDSSEEPGENLPPTNPCPTCKYNEDLKICQKQDEDDCIRHTSKELCDADKTCEYYIDRMETPGPDLKPQAVFNCEEEAGSVGDSSVCITKTNRRDCREAKCEWQCPFTPDSRNQHGYVVKTSIDGVSDPNITLNNQTDNYYAPSDLTVTCNTTWEQSETSVNPSITCIENVGSDPRVDEHTHRMASVGCRPKINCGENKIDNEPITGEVLRNIDLNQVPDVFKTGTGSSETIDPTKIPNSQGSFKCPAPQTLRDNASEITFWNKEQCCYNTGLCKDNTEPSEDIECPAGKIHKKAYYGESTEYLPAQGTTKEVCCIVPEVPTITVPLDADYDEIAGSAGTTLRDTFEQNFCTDIVTILNASDHIDVPITSSMCEILDINDGSVVVTFRLNKDTNGNVILKDQLSKAISSGTTFPTVGAVTNAEPHYKPFDPKAKYLFWSDTLKKGITLEQLIISIFMFVCIISSGLAVMGILLK